MMERRPYRPGPRPGPVGSRFRRPLTEEELETIRAAAKRRGRDGGLDGGFRATWDLLLGEAEGLTMAQANEKGLRFHPSEYAIPESQAEELVAIWRRWRGPKYPRESSAGMLWLNLGPGAYPDEPVPETDGDEPAP